MWFVTTVHPTNYGHWTAVQHGCTGLHSQYGYQKYSYANTIVILTQNTTLHIFRSNSLTIIADIIIKLGMAGTFIPM